MSGPSTTAAHVPGEFFQGDEVLTRAEACRAKAVRLSAKHAKYRGAASSWCIISRHSVHSYAYHFPGGEARLRDHIARGHRVVMIVGVVADPGRSRDNVLYVADDVVVLSPQQTRKLVDEALRRAAARCARQSEA
jgi:hypothetical protein